MVSLQLLQPSKQGTSKEKCIQIRTANIMWCQTNGIICLLIKARYLPAYTRQLEILSQLHSKELGDLKIAIF